MGWIFSLHRTKDGTHLGVLDPVNTGTWSHRAWYQSSGTHVFAAPRGEHTGYPLWNITSQLPASRTLVVSWEDESGRVTPLYAGIVLGVKYDPQDSTITLSHRDIWYIWDRRFILGRFFAANNPGVRAMDTWVDFAGRSLQWWVAGIVGHALRGPRPDLVSMGDLPVIVPYSPSSGIYSKRYYTYEFTSATEAFQEVSEVVPECLIDFVPIFTGQNRKLSWELSVRTTQPRTFMLNGSAPGSSVVSWEVDQEWSEYGTEVNILGAGSEQEQGYFYRWVASDTQDRIHLAYHESRPKLETLDDMDAASVGAFLERRVAARQFDLTVKIGEAANAVPAHFLQLGARILFHTEGDSVVGDGPHDLRLIGYSYVSGDEVRLELSSEDIFQG